MTRWSCRPIVRVIRRREVSTTSNVLLCLSKYCLLLMTFHEVATENATGNATLLDIICALMNSP